MKKRILSTLMILGIGVQLLAQNVVIPDVNFKNYLLGINSLNSNGDTEIQVSEAVAYTSSINCSNLNISDLTGIEAFTSLTNLFCRGNNLTSLDVSNIPTLKRLQCFSNNISNLDVSNNTALTELVCSSNNLNSLDISNNSALTILQCHTNSLTSLNLNNNPNLTQIWCELNSITSLDLSNKTSLVELGCDRNNLNSLNLSNTSSLSKLKCHTNNLNSLDVNTCLALSEFNCRSNNLNSLDVSNNTALTNLNCGDNDISSLNISNNLDLIYLLCDRNDIPSLDVSTHSNIIYLYCEFNDLTSLDVSNNINLEQFWCGWNDIATLDVTNNTLLTRFECQSNELTVLDVSNNTALTIFDCQINNLNSININTLSALDRFGCGRNVLTDLDLNNNLNITSLECDRNELTELDLSLQTGLTKLICYDNDLYKLNVANGNNSNITSNFNFRATGNPNLSCIKVDNITFSDANWTNIDATTSFTNGNYPIVSAGISQSICEQEMTTLAGSGALTYQWDNGITDNTPFSATLGSTTFIVTGTNGEGCTGIDSVTVTASALPTVEAGAAQTVCNGDQVTLSGSGTLTYQWDNGITDNVAFTPTLGVTTYTVTGSDVNGCSNTDNLTITVNALPTVAAGTAQSVCDGETVTLSGSGATTYTWNNGITDNISFTPTIGVTNYTVTGTDVNGCINTDMVAITTNSVPLVDAGANQAVCHGEMVILSGSGATTYLWNNGVTDNVSFTPSVGMTTYSVTGTNNAGCSNSDNVTVTANELPNTSTSLTGNVITADLTGANYQWVICNNSNTEINGETGNSFTANANGDYAVIVSLNGCSDTSSCVNVASVGISEATLFNQVSVYPNPTKDIVTIQLGDLKDVSLTVYSITGKIVYQATNVNSSVHQFNLKSAAGVYVLSLVSNGETKQYQLIKE